MTRKILRHYQMCQDLGCSVCMPVKNHVARQRAAQEGAEQEAAELEQQLLQADL